MPIKPENKAKYPDNWPDIVARIRERAGDRCEWCGIPNHCHINRKTREICTRDEDDVIYVVCTTAHLNHTEEDCRDENLSFLCQKCHNNYDRPHRNETIRNGKLVGQLKLF